MPLKCGLVGLPNAGKTTLFNALTQGHAHAATYPFTTIDPNVGMAVVPDLRLVRLAELVPHDKVIPAMVEFVDIAGLVKGASHGEGLGNQFLSHLMDIDAIIHVMRCFRHEDVPHITGELDPLRDYEIVELELALKDVELIDRWLERHAKLAKTERGWQPLVDLVKQLHDHLSQGQPARSSPVIRTEAFAKADLSLLTVKPELIVGNRGEEEDGAVERLQQLASDRGFAVEVLCAKLEEELAQLDPQERREFMQELKLADTGIERIARRSYQLLNLVTFFTTDSRILRAWPVPKGSTAPQAAGKIHSDFERGFIRAEVVHYDEFVKAGNEAKARELGTLHTEGKDYVVRDGDVIHFKFHVASA